MAGIDIVGTEMLPIFIRHSTKDGDLQNFGDGHRCHPLTYSVIWDYLLPIEDIVSEMWEVTVMCLRYMGWLVYLCVYSGLRCTTLRPSQSKMPRN